MYRDNSSVRVAAVLKADTYYGLLSYKIITYGKRGGHDLSNGKQCKEKTS